MSRHATPGAVRRGQLISNGTACFFLSQGRIRTVHVTDISGICGLITDTQAVKPTSWTPTRVALSEGCAYLHVYASLVHKVLQTFRSTRPVRKRACAKAVKCYRAQAVTLLSPTVLQTVG